MDTIRSKYWSFIPRRGSGRTDRPAPIRPELVAGAIARAREGLRVERRGADGDVRRDAAARRSRNAPGRRRAARGARGGDGHVRGQPQHQHLQRLHRRLRVLRLRPGQALSRRLRARRAGVRRAASTRRCEFGASELCIQSGIHPDWALEDYLGWLRLAKATAAAAGADLHLHAYSPMEIAHMCDISGLPPGGGVRAPARRRARLDAGHRRGGAARRRARAHLAEQAAGRALGADHRGFARGRAALDRDGHVRPYRGAVGAGRAHAGGARAAGANRRDHRVRAAVVHPLPDAARAHARGAGDLARGEPQAHRRRSASRWGAPCRACRPAG